LLRHRVHPASRRKSLLSQLALYGLGNVRDDRFARLIASNGVKFRRPAPPDGGGGGGDSDEEDLSGGGGSGGGGGAAPEDFFSVFMIHQNR
jgi:uncharacterized membrane protein YgcG